MFVKTDNPYRFKYLQTAVTGEGLKQVYLPIQPPDEEILFKEEQKFIRPELPEHLLKETKKWLRYREAGQDYVSPFAKDLKEWEDKQWKWAQDGMWFWNGGEAVYLTPFYAWYLCNWEPYFGHPVFRDTDRELAYFVQYCEEDPECFGALMNTIRRYGKSSFMGGWIIYRTTMNSNHTSGMQGEKDDKIAKFYNKMVLKPFRKLSYIFKPVYDTSTKLTNGIKFEKRTKLGKKALLEELDDEAEDLQSELDYRPSGEGEYDGEVLHSYLNEEPGKTLTCSITDRWDIVKPALKKGTRVRGKALMGTTVEFMSVSNKGGRAYRTLFYDSDFDNRGKDGRTISGMYVCFIPGDCALEDFLDEHGRPMREAAKEYILNERDAVKNRPDKYSGLIRKYPLYISEIFYVNAADCVFNATILQDRLAVINMSKTPLTSKVEFYWENNVRFGKVKWRHSPSNGWAKAAWLPDKPEDTNLVDKKVVDGVMKYFPKNQAKFCGGVDPVDHSMKKIQSENQKEEMKTNKRSTPVTFVKRKYDSSIDGPLTQEILEKNAEEKFPYQTNRNIVMMDVRTGDPNIYYERVLMICWFFGMEIQVETNKPGVKNWFYAADCEGFLQQKYVAESDKKTNPYKEEGTAANQTTIGEYTDAKATYIEYFGHTICYRELIEDDLLFDPANTRLFDYSVADGWAQLAAKVQPKNPPKQFIDISTYIPFIDPYGNLIN